MVAFFERSWENRTVVHLSSSSSHKVYLQYQNHLILPCSPFCPRDHLDPVFMPTVQQSHCQISSRLTKHTSRRFVKSSYSADRDFIRIWQMVYEMTVMSCRSHVNHYICICIARVSIYSFLVTTLHSPVLWCSSEVVLTESEIFNSGVCVKFLGTQSVSSMKGNLLTLKLSFLPLPQSQCWYSFFGDQWNRWCQQGQTYAFKSWFTTPSSLIALQWISDLPSPTTRKNLFVFVCCVLYCCNICQWS